MSSYQLIAPGAPGIKPAWTSSSKSGIGKAINAASQVAFTISHGILNEVYYPREDIACIRDLELLVTDGKDFFSEEKRHADHKVESMEDGIPAFKVINTCHNKRYTIVKEIVTDPARNTVLQKISFKNDLQANYHLHVLLAPHLNNQGADNTGWLGEYKGIPMMFANSDGLFLAIACSSNWLKRSAGFVGSSDGWTDLDKNKIMTWEYVRAEHGNIALIGEVDLTSTADFTIALSFGRNQDEAASHAWGSLLEGFESSKLKYMQEWREWFKGLRTLRNKNYKTSATVLRLHEAKIFPGGIIASLSIPWGETKGDADKGGYHLVWPRDLVEAAGGFLALKSKEDAIRIVNYLMSTLNPDGSWPQNMWLEGSSYWKGKQLDQTALPIILIDKCNTSQFIESERMQRYWPLIKKAITYLILNGPYTPQDRWEEEEGYSTFTIATAIAGLLAGADLAELNGEKSLAAYCRDTADHWNDQIETWTYVTDTALAKEIGVKGYYIRINPFHNLPANELGDRTINLKNHKDEEGKTLLRELVSADALALVRFGLRAANDPRILNTIKVIDAKLKLETEAGPCWYRYNNDGYGEDATGNAYNETGIGRPWPLLTGERAHYEIAAGNIEQAKALLKTMDAFSNCGLLPEQIWDKESIPEKELVFSKHSGSAMPLTWTHAEYIKLCVSIENKEVFDLPTQTKQRYIKEKKVSQYCIWRFDNHCKTLPYSKMLRIETMTNALIHWTFDGWRTTVHTPSIDTGIGIFIADLTPPEKSSGPIEFTFFWPDVHVWENRNFVVERQGKVS